ncbi:hypothetical protein BDI4_1200062 [Burkholderia diffusa]|nr:hypothetical protein BDI4_1200062 [Burkholderia diffusa]
MRQPCPGRRAYPELGKHASPQGGAHAYRPREGQREPHHAHRKNQYPAGRIVHGRMQCV